MPVDIGDYSGGQVHMIGIGGSSMSGLAEMLKKQGYNVSGSDSSESHTLEALRNMGIDARAGHYPNMVREADIVIYSAAISKEDIERKEAYKLNIPQMERAVLLGQLMRGFDKRICVSGTHGKTTTCAMLAQILIESKFNPTIHVGGRMDSIGGSTRVGSKDIFLVEACEFNRSFLQMSPSIALVLNIEEDHMDCFGNMEGLENAFYDFLSLLPPDGAIIAFAEDDRVMRLCGRMEQECITFGMDIGDWTVKNLIHDEKGSPSFTALYKGKEMAEISLIIGGDFNVLHALAALACAHYLGVDLSIASKALAEFKGVHRRFEFTGEVKGMRLYHDYGHNPAEMQAAISVAKLQNRRVIAVMQPHTYSRVINMFNDYLTCTKDADITLVTDIYGAREIDPGNINSQMLVDGMLKNGVEAYLTPSFDDTEQFLLKYGKEGDLVLTMGCGNIDLLNEQMQINWDKSEGR